MIDKVRRAASKKDQPELASCDAGRPEVFAPKEPLSVATQGQISVLQRLQAHVGKASYGGERDQALAELNISDRHLYRLQREYERAGLAGIKP